MRCPLANERHPERPTGLMLYQPTERIVMHEYENSWTDAGELAYLVAEREHMFGVGIGPLTERAQAESDSYDRYCEEMDRCCHASYSTGGHDPYGTSCELEAGHAGPHVGPEPFGSGQKIEWSGGGMCAGDPLPYRGVRVLPISTNAGDECVICGETVKPTDEGAEMYDAETDEGGSCHAECGTQKGWQIA